ncbi:MAG TPA: DUF1552 domain-containing protein [Polyangiaceae bacterium]|nr:DUF1552 domain-containing protein [Polyangiaceae bacterium]
MKRRNFLFTSMQAALLLSPVLSVRRAEAEAALPKRVFFWVHCGGYPDEAAFFPSGSENDFQLSPMLQGLGDVKSEMVVVEGVDLRDSGLNPKGNNHIRTVGKVLTAKDVLPNPTDSLNGEPGGISIDQLLARDLGLSSLEVIVHTGASNHMRGKPFATGPNQFKVPIAPPEQAWDKAFKGFQPGDVVDPAKEKARMNRLRARRSVLDDLTTELKNFRQELSGIEKLKLDAHEDAIRRAELSVLADLDTTQPKTDAECSLPGRETTNSYVPNRAKAHLDVMFAALACNRVQVGGMIWGYSGYSWRYEWVPGVNTDGIHDDVHHRASAERDAYIKSCQWDWNQLGQFVKRLKDTPEGTGSMLDNTVIVALSHFGKHHQMKKIPVVLFGNAAGQLKTNRYLKLGSSVHNDKLLTSVAHLMGHKISGIGDDQNCGPLSALHG